ncbi:MAG: TonB-dependent receptor [Anaeromyxobacter sp.]
MAARIMFHALQAELETPVTPWLRQESSLQLSLQSFRTTFGPEFFFDLDALGVAGRTAWMADVRQGLQLRAGLDVNVTPVEVNVNAPQVPKEGEPQPPISTLPIVGARLDVTAFEPAAFLDATWEPRPGLRVIPGVRLDYYSAISQATVDPRLAVRWEATRATALKAGVGLFQQPPQADESAEGTGTPDLQAERALHVSGGFEHRFGEAVDVDLTGFWKSLDRMVVRNPASAYDPSAPSYVNSGTGRIYGLEALVRGRWGDRASGWIAYTYQRSLRRDRPGEAERPFDFDQPHNLTAVGSWAFARNWSLGTRFRLVSGNPDTPVQGSVFDAASGVYVPLYGKTNSERLPAFGQLDVRVDRSWLYRTWKLTAFLDVQNVTNRGNVEGWDYSYDYGRREALTGLPILPILGVEGSW